MSTNIWRDYTRVRSVAEDRVKHVPTLLLDEVTMGDPFYLTLFIGHVQVNSIIQK